MNYILYNIYLYIIYIIYYLYNIKIKLLVWIFDILFCAIRRAIYRRGILIKDWVPGRYIAVIEIILKI
jgi:hypothetical protein